MFNVLRAVHTELSGILNKLFAAIFTAVALFTTPITIFGKLSGLTASAFHYFHYTFNDA
jgi:hypothetical protein